MSTEYQETEPADDRGAASWFSELRRRKVFRVMGAYGVGAWLILQATDILSGAFPLPNWTVAAMTVILALGFPIAAALSWAFQVTPEGVVLDLEESKPLTRNRSRLIHFVDVVIIVVLAITVAYLSIGERFTSYSASEIRVAVLPFENLTNDENATYLGYGLADDIRTRLNEIPQLRIAARSSSANLAGQGLDISTLGSRLTVEHVLEGSVRVGGDHIRVMVQLVDVDSGLSRWTKTYDTRFDDILEMQNNISLVVASELELLLSKDVRESLARNATDDTVAWDYYLQANEYMRRPRNMENLSIAIELFQRAVAQDPAFALGYAGLCDADIVRYDLSNDTAYIASAESHCAQAIAADPTRGEIHAVNGKLLLETGRIDEAEVSFRRAIELDPRSMRAFEGMGQVFVRQGKLVEAEARFNAAIEARPGNWLGYDQLGFFLLSQGRYDEAIDAYERVLDLSPDNAHGYNNLGVVHYMIGDFASAADYWRMSLDIEPGRAAYSNTGSTYYLAGNYAEAAKMFKLAAAEAQNDFRLWGNLADAQRFLEPDGPASAQENYRRAIDLALLDLSVSGENAETSTYLAWYYANIGETAAAQRYLTDAIAKPDRDMQQLYFDALIYAVLGQEDNAAQVLLALEDRGFPQAILESTPELRHLVSVMN